ncbi:MAG: MerR family transcriptional regulator [Planctomycetes bacterium]|nr:MerR family transcriptional regulator [Planctomycetota bacterium]
MTLPLPPQDELVLDTLAARTGFTPRTIRSYVARGLIPPPTGRGPAARYGEEHLVPLLFLKQVRKSAPYELPLSALEGLLKSLPADQIERVARGEEGVATLPLTGMGLARAAPDPHKRTCPPFAAFGQEPQVPFDLGPKRLQKSPHSPTPAVPEEWTLIDVTPSVRLSMRGSDPETARMLADLAGRLRGWLAGADPG